METFEFEVDDITAQHTITDFIGMVIKARNEAIKRGIKADSIIINKNMVFVPGVIDLYPAMVCGLNVYVTKDELPDGYSFAVAESQREKTNADRIRAMSDEELAWELMTWRLETEAKHHGIESNYPNTQATILEWLKQPAEE